MRDEIRAELDTPGHDHDTVVDAECAAALLSNLQELWDGEDDEGRRIIMAGIVEAVWCDLDKNG